MNDPDLVEAVAEAIMTADTTSWKHDEVNDITTFVTANWSDMSDETVEVPWEGISLGRDHYRALAVAAIGVLEDRGKQESQ